MSKLISLAVLSFTCIAVLGLLWSGLRRCRIFSVAGFIMMVNVACAVAAYNFVTGQRMTQWNLPRDSEPTPSPEVKS